MRMAADDDKPKLRCLDAARYAVASAVTVLILVVIVDAVVTVLRPGDLTLKVTGGYVSADNTSGPGNVTLRFTLRALNPSGRVRIYYTGIKGTFSGQINTSAPAEDFRVFRIGNDIAIEQQDSAEVAVLVSGPNNPNVMPPAYFNLLFNGGTIHDAMLKLNGSRTFEDYSGHNKTAEPAVYYCPSITVGGEYPETPDDLQCTEQLPASASS
uniref:Late embryogenesis abundant protein LEA-2 subgroup domain-containing protein n=1 Tax=Arundo donax TaxID=35708 RepID=A0A0A9B8X5_ARUDO